MIVIEGPHFKWCFECSTLKPLTEEFWGFTEPRPGKRYIRHTCKACFILKQRAFRKKRHSDPKKRQQYLDNKRERKMNNYGISQAEYELMSTAQDDRCAICRARAKLHVDHDHNTGKVRALLCIPCNTSLGLMKENPRAIARMIDYLKEHK